MIVRNRALTHEKARTIANKIIEQISKESILFDDSGDPAEQIYLTVHTLALINSQMIVVMDGFGKIYNIPKFNGKVFKKWVHEVVKEILAQNKNLYDEIFNKIVEENIDETK